MLRTVARITDDLDAWRKRNEPHISLEADAQLARLIHELRALETGHDSRICEECEGYAIDQLDARQRVAQADQLRARMLQEGYPLPDVPRPLYEQIRHPLKSLHLPIWLIGLACSWQIYHLYPQVLEAQKQMGF